MAYAFNSASGPVRGSLRLEPYMRPPCGIHVEAKRHRARHAQDDLTSGASLVDMRALGYTVLELAREGFSATELVRAGYPPIQVAATRRFQAPQLRAAGCTVMDCIGGAATSLTELLQAGYNARELGEAGISEAALAALRLPALSTDDPSLAPPTRPRSARPYTAEPRRAENMRQTRRPTSAHVNVSRGHPAAAATA